MHVITATNVESAWTRAKELLQEVGVSSPSRAGDVIVSPLPVTTLYTSPTRRVLNDPTRDANPFFHLMEALWMLAGRHDVAWITQFNKRMESYSDDGVTFHGAYGYRWRKHFDLDGGGEPGFGDQLAKAASCLRADPLSRRVVVQMWDPIADLWAPEDMELGPGTTKLAPKDLPCNTAIYFDCRNGKLNMTVTNRSNDVVWGCYGANVVHMSLLQEYMAAMIGVEVGWYCQVSHNWHAYASVWEKQDRVARHGYCGVVFPLVSVPSVFDADLERFVEMVEPSKDFSKYLAMSEPVHANKLLEFTLTGEPFVNHFFNKVAVPMLMAYRCHKLKDESMADVWLSRMPKDCDWHIAATDWVSRRRDGKSSAQGDAVLGQ